MSAIFDAEGALRALQGAGGEFTTLFRHGTLEVEIYRPVGVDKQQPHRFVEFTPDFATWVFFYGPDGGERP